jgi:ADP-heptose:LPS heptosyltransferase
MSPRLRLLVEAEHVVCWFGARDPAFVARVRALAPSAVVAPSVASTGLVWEHLLATVGGDTIAADRASLSVPSSLLADGARALRASGWDGERPLLMLHPGAGGIAKRWPAEGFTRVLTRLGSTGKLAVVVHQGPADADAVADFVGRHHGPVLRLVDPALPLLAGVVSHAKVWLGNDSGPSHLAAALGVPAIVLFTAPKLAWRSWSAAARPLVVATDTLQVADVDRVIADLTALLG